MKKWIILFNVICLYSCVRTADCTRHSDKKMEYEIKEFSFDSKHPYHVFDHFTADKEEYFAFYGGGKIYIVDMGTQQYVDSVDMSFLPDQDEKYGLLETFNFYDKNNIYALYEEAAFHIKDKKLEKIVPINDLNEEQSELFRFETLNHADVFYDAAKNELIGEVYCSGCAPADTSFFRQRILGGLNMETGEIHLYDITFPQMYIDNYYGFAILIHMDNKKEKSYISFPCDPHFYIIDRSDSSVKEVCGRSRYQKTDASPLDTSAVYYTEEKMRHMVVSPFYAEIKYDKYKDLIYRIYLTDIPLKDENGKYNKFEDKRAILMVFNNKDELINEIPLESAYNNYISFVGKDGLYINYKDKRKGIESVFKCFKFEE